MFVISLFVVHFITSFINRPSRCCFLSNQVLYLFKFHLLGKMENFIQSNCFCRYTTVTVVPLGGFQRRRTQKWDQRWDFVDWQMVSQCLSNERKFHMHWSCLNIFLGIIVPVTPKKPKLHSKQCLRSRNVRNAGQCDHRHFDQPKNFIVYFLRFLGNLYQ